MLAFKNYAEEEHFGFGFENYKFEIILELFCFPQLNFAVVTGTNNKKAQILTLNMNIELHDYYKRVFDFQSLNFTPHGKNPVKTVTLDSGIVQLEFKKIVGYYVHRLNLNGPKFYFGVSTKQIEGTSIQK